MLKKRQGAEFICGRIGMKIKIIAVIHSLCR
uniref:Uncharacterized protein n=1 Tax=Myoviridae sp. ctqfO1 TaxID=2827710 RepID=A0A8S5T2A2_9CAUD|nr:MAG TPA: hypothetical protein [Myoviridae sp. ctqfO1]